MGRELDIKTTLIECEGNQCTEDIIDNTPPTDNTLML
jgi:hypothetical protein